MCFFRGESRLVLIHTLFACLRCGVVAALGSKFFSPRQLLPGEVWTPSQFHAARKQRYFCVATIRLWAFLSKCCSVNTLACLNWTPEQDTPSNSSICPQKDHPRRRMAQNLSEFSHQFSQIFSQPQSKKIWKDVGIYQLGKENFYI